MDDKWIQTLAGMPHGIYVLTTHDKDRINGMIVSWVSQISQAPPMIMVAVHPNRFSHDLIERSGTFALHLLSRGQKDLLTRFKGPDPEAKFHALPWRRGKTGCPVLGECLGYLECVVRATYAPGNHTLFVGEVVTGERLSGAPPLTTLDYEGTYLGKA